jgi:hypothetical protein
VVVSGVLGDIGVSPTADILRRGQLIPNYFYVVIRLKMAESVNSLIGTTLICHYGETNDVFPIGGLVQPGETLKAAAIRYCRHLVNFRIEQNDRLYIAK